jgi:YVTN family beta-propeller protein
MKICSLILGIFLLSANGLFAQPESKPYKIQKIMPVSGNGTWDYLVFDNATQRIFISHGDGVQVLDKKTGKQIGSISPAPGVHGIAIGDSGKGFISCGTIDSVIVFNLKTLKITGKIPTGKDPDAILFDRFSNRVFVFNSKGNSVTVIDEATEDVLSTVRFRGNPEFAVTDGSGSIYVNIQNLGMVFKIDAMTLEIKGMYPIGPDKQPTGMALDKGTNNLFCGCSGTNELVVLDLLSGNVIATIPIGLHCDGVCFMPALNEIFTSNGEGTITVIHQDAPDKYSKEQTLITKRGARTLTCDYVTRSLYLPVAEFNDVTKEYNKNSFQLLVVAR